MQKVLILLAVLVCSAAGITAQINDTTQGTLVSFNNNGARIGVCPLKHTDVKAEISGFIVRVDVTQEFENKFNRPIEAVYKFPLPQNSAVDNMTMRIGDRVIRAKIMKREEANAAYESAKSTGKTASLLDQERPNIFTQQVANILPNEKIIIQISFVQTLKYEDGEFEFMFPMTIGERYISRSMRSKNAKNTLTNIASTRAGHDISIEVKVDAGVRIEEVRSPSHDVETLNLSSNKASLRLRVDNVIPNRDFVLRYDVTGKRIEDAVLTHRDERGGFFTLLLSPPEKFANEDVTPKEIVFLLDVSGSMSGFPIEKAKKAMQLSLEGLNPQDTFNLITFASGTNMLFENPVPATVANLQKAKSFLRTLSGGGGTEMMTAIKAALTPSDSQRHIRIVCFMTDGHVGDDMSIIGEVQKQPNARVFAFGIGSSTNRFLLDKIAEAGRGEAEYVSLEDDGEKAARRFYERVRSPLLTDISVDWNGLSAVDIFPIQIPDLFSAKPVIIHGRYLKPGKATIYLKGNVAGQQLVRPIEVNFPESDPENDVLATLWARTKIDDLMSQDWEGVQNGDPEDEIKSQIEKLGIEFRLMTQFTSFVAVEGQIRTNGEIIPKLIVPNENPDGVIVKTDESPLSPSPTPRPLSNLLIGKTSVSPKVTGAQRGQSNTKIGGSAGTVKIISGGVVNGKALNLPAPSLPAAAKAVGAIGTVSVQITIDESGNVISSSAVSGHPLLRSAAENAALRSKFGPTSLAGKPIKVSAIIVYNFVPEWTTVTSTTDSKEISLPPFSPELIKRRNLEEKFHPKILAAVDVLKSALPVDAKFLRDGVATVEIWVNEDTPELRMKLANVGFKLREKKFGMYFIGEIAVEKLEELAEIMEIQYIAPMLK